MVFQCDGVSIQWCYSPECHPHNEVACNYPIPQDGEYRMTQGGSVSAAAKIDRLTLKPFFSGWPWRSFATQVDTTAKGTDPAHHRPCAPANSSKGTAPATQEVQQHFGDRHRAPRGQTPSPRENRQVTTGTDPLRKLAWGQTPRAPGTDPVTTRTAKSPRGQTPLQQAPMGNQPGEGVLGVICREFRLSRRTGVVSEAC